MNEQGRWQAKAAPLGKIEHFLGVVLYLSVSFELRTIRGRKQHGTWGFLGIGWQYRRPTSLARPG